MKRLFIIIILMMSNAYAYCYDFEKIDNLVGQSISNRYFPGAQLIIGTSREILYEKCYGRLTYEQDSRAIDSYSIYDLASVTKAVATTSAIMKLYDDNKIKLDDRVSDYIPEFAANDKGNITILNLLLHNSGLKAWIPFYKTCSCKEDVLRTLIPQAGSRSPH